MPQDTPPVDNFDLYKFRSAQSPPPIRQYWHLVTLWFCSENAERVHRPPHWLASYQRENSNNNNKSSTNIICFLYLNAGPIEVALRITYRFPRVFKMNTRNSTGIVILFICWYKLVFMSKFPALPFSAEICPLLQENAIKQYSVFFNLWKVEKVTCCVWVFYSQNIHTHPMKQTNKNTSII